MPLRRSTADILAAAAARVLCEHASQSLYCHSRIARYNRINYSESIEKAIMADERLDMSWRYDLVRIRV